MGKSRRSIPGAILKAPQTWLALVTVLVLEAGYGAWFRPPAPLFLAALGLGAFLALLWPVIFIRSDSFGRRYYGLPAAVEEGDLKRLLDRCEPDFQTPALACLALAHRIRNEFKAERFHDEVDAVLRNLGELARNHVELRHRAQTFGTAAQKQTMGRMLRGQAESVEGALDALKKFSGNLTLFDLQVRDQAEIDTELKAINMGLQEAMKETR